MHNVGSIFRTADAAGCEKIYLCGITPGPLDRFGRPNQKLLKVSLGAERYMPWERSRLTMGLLDKLKVKGYRILAVEQSKNSISLYKMKPLRSKSTKCVLVVGNEINGLSPALLKRADKVIEIPMRGKKESLNVAVAFGIAVFYLLR
ncbi:hypothetical protein A3E96_03740 [Candidatus Uhrbacteria bacterium RIFCSPHIGHO2_12_FULL_46_13]|nr:MAG: hypothetical protein A3D60_04485 [Candidatus Uhrbacteria bacterium RIFCSPHIGHO2_02_FULL_47_29]OGL75940.1 MAG: hypothetical protein A3E96_03740 [Candidatus Uhrbacteria bacterium RIFCSPHIGHO2_12_FULL_46_13]